MTISKQETFDTVARALMKPTNPRKEERATLVQHVRAAVAPFPDEMRVMSPHRQEGALLRPGITVGEIRTLCRVALSSQPPRDEAKEVPEGWKLVPVEPTEELFEAMDRALRDPMPDTWRRVYAAMLAAAPNPDTLTRKA